MANKTENFGSDARTSQGVGKGNTDTMHIYGSGDQVGSKDLPKAGEIMRKRAEQGTNTESNYTDKGGK